MCENYYLVDKNGFVHYYGRSSPDLDLMVAEIAEIRPRTIFFMTIETTDLGPPLSGRDIPRPDVRKHPSQSRV